LKKYDIQYSNKIIKTYIKEDCSKLNIIAPMYYIFNNIQDFNRIHSDLFYTESYTKLHKPFPAEAALFGIDYAFLETKEQLKLDVPSVEINDPVGNYRVIGNTRDIVVFRRIK
jgi:hypothetical protein